MKAPNSLEEQALVHVIRLVLENPSLLNKLPTMMRRRVARESRDALYNFFSLILKKGKRKVFTKKSFATFVNSKEFDNIPKKFKTSSSNIKSKLKGNIFAQLATFITA